MDTDDRLTCTNFPASQAAGVASPRGVFSDAMRGVSDNWSPYAILGVAETCEQSEITAAYRRLSLRFHPDHTTQLGEGARAAAEERMIAINQAYQAIGSVRRRTTFDAERALRKAGLSQNQQARPASAASGQSVPGYAAPGRSQGQGDPSARSSAYLLDEDTYRRYTDNRGPFPVYQRPWFIPSRRTVKRIVAAFLVLVFVALLWPAKDLEVPTQASTALPTANDQPIPASAQPGQCAFVQLVASSNYETEASGWLAQPLELETRGYPIFVATRSELSDLEPNVMIVGVRTYGQSERYAALAAAANVGVPVPLVRVLPESDCKSLISFVDLRNGNTK